MEINPEHVNLIESWAHSPLKFVMEALRPDRFQKPELLGLSGITNQQKDALTQLGKYIHAKLKKINGMRLSAEEQKLILKRGISIMSGQGVGKDTFAAWCLIWFLCCFPKALVPATAPTGHQLKDVLWREVYKWIKGSMVEDWLTWQSDKIFFTEKQGREWYAIARTANPNSSPEEQTETLAGLHEEFMMILIDEGSGVPEPVFKPLEGTMTGKCNFAIIIFNPTRSTGFAIETQQKFRDQWICLQWNGEESELVTKEHIEYMERKYGRNSNAFRVRVLGIPPLADPDTLIPWEWVMAAVNRDIVPSEHDPVIFGLDIGAGGDPSALLSRQSNNISKIETFNTDDSEKLTGWALGRIYDMEPSDVFIDIIGWGWGVAGNLKARQHVSTVWDVNVAESAALSDRFYRLRDELWWNVRDKFERQCISIPNDDELIGELTTIKYSEDGNGKIKVESKKDLKKRGLMSPNKADALCLTEYFQGNILRSMAQVRNKKKKHGERAGWKTI